MKDIFDVNEFETLNISNLEVDVYEEADTNYRENNLSGTATIDFEEFQEVYMSNLKLALEEGENYTLELNGFVEVKGIEFKVNGYRLNNGKIELIFE